MYGLLVCVVTQKLDLTFHDLFTCLHVYLFTCRHVNALFFLFLVFFYLSLYSV
jgi:hypothetical protein